MRGDWKERCQPIRTRHAVYNVVLFSRDVVHVCVEHLFFLRPTPLDFYTTCVLRWGIHYQGACYNKFDTI